MAPATNDGIEDAIVFGRLDEASCEGNGSSHVTVYAARVPCAPHTPATCRVQFTGLQPGRWIHRVLITSALGQVQLQARRDLLLDASAGTYAIEWPVFASVSTVYSLSDASDCSGCLRAALASAEMAPKPALVQFAPEVTGTTVLQSALPPLESGDVCIDARDLDGRPYQRGLDANGLGSSALIIKSARNTLRGLRVANVGRNSDTVLIDGTGADDNLIEQVQVVGRATQVCGTENEGCVIDGACRTPQTDPEFGVCGDDGIAVRNGAGAGGANVIRDCEVTGAFDKGIKVSDFGVARVEHSHVYGNRDGGLQATFGGTLTAVENLVEDNLGTTSANGIATNGAAVGSNLPARLETRGNICRGNALRGISIRNLSAAALNDDYVCGNSRMSQAFGLAILDIGRPAADIAIAGVASVHNGGGVAITGVSSADLGGKDSPGDNAFAFNGTAGQASAANVQNHSAQVIPATNNQWEHCGRGWVCNEAAIRQADVFSATGAGTVTISPSQPHHRRRPAAITAAVPSFAAAGDVVRLYGHGFDAIDGNGPDATCETINGTNTCHPTRGNCVFVDRQPAEVIAVTPTMLVIRAPFTCVIPVTIAVRTKYARGTARFPFCTLADTANGSDASLTPRGE